MKVIIEKNEDGAGYIAYNIDVKGMVAIGTGMTIEETKSDFENSLKELAEDMSPQQKEALITNPEYQILG